MKNHITLKCGHCGKDYLVEPYRAAKSKFCSSSCRALAPKPMLKRQMLFICQKCGNEYSAIQARKETTKFCSRVCAASNPRSEEIKKAQSDRLRAQFDIGREEREAARKARKSVSDAFYYQAHKEESAAYGKAYYEANKEASNANSKRWAEENAARITELNRLKREKDGDRIRAKRRQHYQENKAAYIANARKREIEKLQATPSWADLNKILEFYVEANRLTEETGIKHHVDHIYPLRGKNSCGLHVHWNLQVVPAKDNLKKGNALPQGIAALAIVD